MWTNQPLLIHCHIPHSHLLAATKLYYRNLLIKTWLNKFYDPDAKQIFHNILFAQVNNCTFINHSLKHLTSHQANPYAQVAKLPSYKLSSQWIKLAKIPEGSGSAAQIFIFCNIPICICSPIVTQNQLYALDLSIHCYIGLDWMEAAFGATAVSLSRHINVNHTLLTLGCWAPGFARGPVRAI